MPTDLYRSSEGINFSTLKYIGTGSDDYCPAMYRKAKMYPIKETDAMKLGTLVHCLLLEPDTFSKRYAILEKKLDLRKTEDKQYMIEFTEDAGGRIIVPRKPKNAKSERFSVEVAEAIAKAQMRKATFKKLMARAEIAEIELFRKCDVTGLELKGCVDLITKNGKTDLKTTSTFTFLMKKVKWDLHVDQVAFYDRLMRLPCQKSGEVIERESSSILYVETIYPYRMQLVKLNERAMANAAGRNLTRLARLAECIKHDRWPDNSDIILDYDEE